MGGQCQGQVNGQVSEVSVILRLVLWSHIRSNVVQSHMYALKSIFGVRYVYRKRKLKSRARQSRMLRLLPCYC